MKKALIASMISLLLYPAGSAYAAGQAVKPAAKQVILNAPLIRQLPELPRGCEVTALAMLLQYRGISANKMTLAAQVKKDLTPYSVQNGRKYFGNPNTGFVGNMYTFSKPGYGVYHGPIAELMKRYLPGKVVDFSGSSFTKIYEYLNAGKPVWVVNNVLFDKVPSVYWQTWRTPAGDISITMKEHSVLVTGYDSSYIYFNDPLSGTKNRRAPIASFRRGWEQMGSQAISYNR
ncbi:C39 family peptidase [Ectobacillus ponti]|uniref:C39 family peptidase n=1 Tax=Ectobacillus ponti TaxID=2961894 RepID=A0AA41X2K7_9BACI|nr:C39 family peptidase [Ectobacillus ponti]MCP8967769.1 C39 family peptidase [Ectobacillus ponti]